MPSFLTLFEDTFVRANESPLSDGGQWARGVQNALQVLNNVCAATNTLSDAFYTGSLPSDQFSQVTLGAFSAPNFPALGTYVRTVLGAGGTQTQGYKGLVFTEASGTSYSAQVSVQPANTNIFGFTGGTTSAGDVFLLAAQGTTIYVYRNGSLVGSVTDSTYSSGHAMLLLEPFTQQSDVVATDFQAGLAFTPFSISGNAGVAGATVSWSGTFTSGTTTADGSGNFSTGVALPNGVYTVIPKLAGYSFSESHAVVTVNGGNVSGVNFTASTYYSQPDSRTIPNAGVTVQGTVQYTGQTSSNSTVPPTDSRTNKPVDSRAPNAGTTPINTRNPAKYNN